MAAPVLELDGVIKRYGDVTAVAGVDLSVPPGVCFGLIGPNGAGKTSLIRMIMGLSPVTGGVVRVFGQDAALHRRAINARVGVVLQDGGVDTELSVMDNLVVYTMYFGIPRREARERAKKALEFVQIQEKGARRISELSGGMQRRLVLARALTHDPEMLILDEPTTGLDPQARHLLWDRVRALRSGGKTVFLTTHYMEEAEQLCDRVAVMDHGRILAEDAPAGLVHAHVGDEIVEVEKRRRANLEDVFLRLTGRELRD